MARDYRKELKDLKRQAHKKGLRVRTNWPNKTWRGMNHEAAKALGVACPPKTFLVSTIEPNDEKRSKTLRHEMLEAHKMREIKERHPNINPIKAYKQAHQYAEKNQGRKSATNKLYEG